MKNRISRKTEEVQMRRARLGLLLLMSALACNAQDKPASNNKSADGQYVEGHFYRLVFKVIDSTVDGKPATTRTYSEVISTYTPSTVNNEELNTTGQIRTSDKVSVHNGTGPANPVDIGTNIDTHSTTDEDGFLHTRVTAEISSVAAAPSQTSGEPVIRQCRWSSRVTVPIGKPTVIFSSDNASDRGKTELELTATPVR
jgi:hypothetical protein